MIYDLLTLVFILIYNKHNGLVIPINRFKFRYKVMPMTAKHFLTAATLALLVLGSPSVMAANLSFTGSFSSDNEVKFLDFSIATDSTAVIINTLSLNGGTNAAGNLIAGGGFDPYLALFDKSTGDWIFDTLNKNNGDEAVISNTSTNPYGTLLAGEYRLALTQFDNIALGNLSDGFAADLGLMSVGLSPFTLNGGGGSGHWAVDILNVDAPQTSVVPLPDSFTLMLIGMVALASITRKKANFLE